MESIACISLWQPWASFIPHGLKRFETRSWFPGWKYKGQLLAIHASKRWTSAERSYALRMQNHFPETHRVYCPTPIAAFREPPLGAVLCVCRVVDFHQTDNHQLNPSALELAVGDWSPGRWLWELKVVMNFRQPIPAMGR